MSEFGFVMAREDGDAMRTPFVLGAQVGGAYRRHLLDYGQCALLLQCFFSAKLQSRGQEPGADFLCYLKSRFLPLSWRANKVGRKWRD